jgi:hypothetical protein
MKDYNFKARCLDNKGNELIYTIGKIYEINNGEFKADGTLIINGRNRKFKNIYELNKFSVSTFELVEDENKVIVIYQKGNEVIANLKEGKTIIKTTKAQCSPSDEFDFNTGAKIALGRLIDNNNANDKDTFDWKRFENRNIAINCDTRAKADNFLKECKEHGFVWNDGSKINLYANWDCYKEKTIYGLGLTGITFGTTWSFENTKVIKYEESKTNKPENQIRLDLSTVSDVTLLNEIQKRMKNKNN